MGYRKTFDRITQNYYRPRLATYVARYIAGCLKCSVNKTLHSKTPGSLLPIAEETPSGTFECVGIDFIVGLLLSRGFDTIIVVIDKFTCYGIFIPTTSDYTAKSLVDLFLQ